MKIRMTLLSAAIVGLAAFSGLAQAAPTAGVTVLSGPGISFHGGGLDKYGCHNDTKRGTYHCH